VKIKRYTAPSMREALAQVRAEQGPDAVILSSRRVEDAMEVIAAVDYDRELFLEASPARQAAVPSQTAPAATPAASQRRKRRRRPRRKCRRCRRRRRSRARRCHRRSPRRPAYGPRRRRFRQPE